MKGRKLGFSFDEFVSMQAKYNRQVVLLDKKWTKGYVSRKNFDPSKAQVYIASGSRNGNYYYLRPSWKSTTYCYRQYFTFK